MSRFGDFARLDDYDPDAGFKDSFASRFGAAPLDAAEAAMLRQRQFTNRPSTTSQETIDKLAGAASDVLIPKTPLDVAATIALGPVGRVPARIGALALGGLLQSDEAQAGPVSKAIGAVLAPLRGKPGGPWEGGIRAYHSSPHDFDKVDFSKLRTGEGANVYGAGHYMAENPAVSGQGGQYWKAFANRFGKSSGENTATEYLARAGFDREKAAQALRHALDNPPEYTSGYNKMTQERMRQDALRILESDQQIIGPRTYEMNLRAKPEELLDWDKPLHQQPHMVGPLNQAGFNLSPAVGDLSYLTQKAKEGGPDSWYAAQLRAVGDMRNKVGAEFKPNNAEQAARLADAGIPGIRYLDEGSRITNPDAQAIISAHGKEGALELARTRLKQADLGSLGYWDKMVRAMEKPQTYNYVGTDPSKLDVLAKYGVAGALPLGALAAQDNYKQ